MTSFGSHYQVDLEEAGMQHVTYDARIVELRATMAGVNASQFVSWHFEGHFGAQLRQLKHCPHGCIMGGEVQ